MHMIELYLRYCWNMLHLVVIFGIFLTFVLWYTLCSWVQNRRGKLNTDTDKEKNGRVSVGLFHPYCNAGGGGERVLWVAIRALQRKYKDVRCVVYTGDLDASQEQILQKARDRFNIKLSQPVEFVFLRRRYLVEAYLYPVFTLLGQSLGSMVLGMEAMLNFVPDVYVDTMGYAFTLPLFRYIAACKTVSYVHYPTISTDMIEKVSSRVSTYNNAGIISCSPFLSSIKLTYYRLFAGMYGFVGRCNNVIMVNSSWTAGHISALWKASDRTHIVYPPCDTREFTAIPLIDDSDAEYYTIASIAQFRPEKDHSLQIRSFHEFLSLVDPVERARYTLMLVGSCRDQGDADRVQGLRDLCKQLYIDDRVEFKLNVSFDELKMILSGATIGLHSMWNEHFGIGVVEIMAAGSIVLAHDSGGPKMDIVVDYEGQSTGFLASDVDSYARSMMHVVQMAPQERLAIRLAARLSVDRFSETNFEKGFLDATEVVFE